MNKNEIKISIPVKDGDIETAYNEASDILRELDAFFARLRSLIYYSDNMPSSSWGGRKLGEVNGVISVIVEKTWEGHEWTAKAIDEYINTYIQHNHIGIN